jgi:uncharacterized membrane protein
MGFFNSVMGLVIFFFIVVAAVVGIVTYHQGQEAGYTAYQSVNNLTWQLVAPPNASDLNNSLGNALYDGVNYVGKYTFEFSKIAAQYGYTHPEVPWKLLVYGVMIAILAPILCYLALFIIVIFLLIREYRMNKKEKKRLNELIERRKSK